MKNVDLISCIFREDRQCFSADHVRFSVCYTAGIILSPAAGMTSNASFQASALHFFRVRHVIIKEQSLAPDAV